MEITPVRKRRNAAATRERILKSAQRVFAEKGFVETGIRDIAAEAGVTAPLLLRYFGSKAGVFEAALIDIMVLSDFLSWPKSQLDEKMASSLTRDEDRQGTSPAVMAAAMIALSTGDPEAREITTRVAEEYAIKPTAEWLGPPHARARAAQLFLISTGFVLYTYKLPLNPGRADVLADMIEWFKKSVRDIVSPAEH